MSVWEVFVYLFVNVVGMLFVFYAGMRIWWWAEERLKTTKEERYLSRAKALEERAQDYRREAAAMR
jgi:hypothetical protein